MLKERGLRVQFSDQAMDWLAEKGFDPDFGARPLKRVFQRQVHDPLAMALLHQNFTGVSVLRVNVGSEGLVFVPEHQK